MAEDGRKYIAYSEEAMAEQIAQLTTIVGQQASAIQNLSASIAALAQQSTSAHLATPKTRYSSPAEPVHRPVVAASTSRMTVDLNRTTKRPAVKVEEVHHTPTAHHSVKVQPTRKKHKLTNGTEKSAYIPISDGEDGHPDPRTADYTEHEEEGSPVLDAVITPSRPALRSSHMTFGPTALDAKNRFLGFLQALRENYGMEICKSVVRARLCDDWIAVRPEELLNRLRDLDLDIPNRKDLMDILQAMGPDIARGRSVKFGKDTRRAVAIPRAYFADQELRQIDRWFLPGVNPSTPARGTGNDDSQQDDEDGGVQDWQQQEAEIESD